jgi:hypothetical protein
MPAYQHVAREARNSSCTTYRQQITKTEKLLKLREQKPYYCDLKSQTTICNLPNYKNMELRRVQVILDIVHYTCIKVLFIEEIL